MYRVLSTLLQWEIPYASIQIRLSDADVGPDEYCI